VLRWCWKAITAFGFSEYAYQDCEYPRCFSKD